ncbi:MAG TPA: ABC transporter ATP-binding protein [Acidimicrobiales bacterium]|nr:ABC transporter ATP-binding protein [Acidimicrobiales bacterium]
MDADSGSTFADRGAPGSRSDAAIAIELRGITKRFPGVVANDQVDLVVRRGDIHAIVGENGSGKSTLMKTLYGQHRPDEGTIVVDGEERQFRSPRDAIAVGIGMVHQHFMLADNLTVWENIALGDEPGSWWHINASEARTRITALADKYGLDVDPDDRVADIGVGERQRVEILKVLFRGAKILILDEPSAVLVPQEVDRLFSSLRELTDEGVTVIFISHKLDEVLAISDSITVIRAGRTVATVDAKSVNARQLAELMIGSELPTPETTGSTIHPTVELELSHVTVRTAEGRALLDDVSLSVRRGEVVGVAGVEGNGQSELLEVVMGLIPLTSGSITFAAQDITSMPTRERREAGIGYIPEDRQTDGLVLAEPLWANVMLGHQTQAPFVKGPWIDRAGAMHRTTAIIAGYQVRAPGPEVPALALSGGNQQKLVIGREMFASPSVLVAAHPTRGIDVGAQAAVWELMLEARRDGLAILLVSADLDELIGLSDTLLVLLRGKVVAKLNPATTSPTELGSYMTGAAEAGTP